MKHRISPALFNSASEASVDDTCAGFLNYLHTFLMSKLSFAMFGCILETQLKHLAQLGSGLGLQTGPTNRHLSPPATSA